MGKDLEELRKRGESGSRTASSDLSQVMRRCYWTAATALKERVLSALAPPVPIFLWDMRVERSVGTEYVGREHGISLSYL